MRSKNLVRVLCLLVVAVLMFTSLVSCKKKVVVKEGSLPNQLVFDRYLVQQGYFEDWDVRWDDSPDGGFYIVNLQKNTPEKYKSGLIATFTPQGENANKITYSIYHLKHNSVTVTQNQLTEGMMDADGTSDYGSLYFNKVFFENEEGTPRANFNVKTVTDVSHLDDLIARYNRIQYSKVEYEFTKDGVNWKGAFFLNCTGLSLCLVVLVVEMQADLWTVENFAKCEELLGDFRFTGHETAED